MHSARLTDVITTAEAAAILGLSAERVLQFARAGRLPGKRIGREWCFHRRDLEEFSAADRPHGVNLSRGPDGSSAEPKKRPKKSQ